MCILTVILISLFVFSFFWGGDDCGGGGGHTFSNNNYLLKLPQNKNSTLLPSPKSANDLHF